MRWWTLLVLALAPPGHALAGEGPLNWFSYQDSTVKLMVCNVVEMGGIRTDLSDFAPSAGAAWAKGHGSMVDCYVFPLKTVGVYLDSSATLRVQVRGGRFYSMLDASWREHPQGGTAYTLVVFAAGFRLKDVTGFVLEPYVLKSEGKLR
jgi:hypothetical protein